MIKVNEKFKGYVTGGFSLNLSKRQVIALLSITGGPDDESLNISSYHALERRGLVEWLDSAKGKSIFVTDAGELVSDLLKQAGY